MKKDIFKHLVAWIGFWGFLLLIGGAENRNWKEALFSTSAISLASTFGSYLNFNLLKRFFQKQKYGYYLLWIFIGFFMIDAVMYFSLKLVVSYDIRFGQNMITLLFTCLLSSGVYFMRNDMVQRVQLQEAKSKQMEAEMNLLKIQIQPHFLFNALNNLYATNLQNPEKTNDMILQLADLLRYQLEAGKHEKISLEQEIALTENYIALEKIRLKEGEVIVNKSGEPKQLQIVPLLLLPLVENAFKHSLGIGKQFIHILFSIDNEVFTFECANSIARNPKPSVSNQIGLENVKRRLEAFYANQFNLEIEKTEHTFKLVLSIKLI